MENNVAFSTVKEVANARKSVRKYTEQPIPKALLEEVLTIAQTAPSAWNLQPWRYIVVTEPELKGKIQAAAYGQGQVGGAPAVLVMYSDMQDTLANLDDVVHAGMPNKEAYMDGIRGAFANNTSDQTEAWGNAQSNIALGFLLVTAKAAGLDTSAMLGFNPENVKDLLGLPAHVKIPALVAIGYGAEEGFPHLRHSVDTISTWR